MTLDNLVKLLSTAKLPLSIAVMGMALNLGGSNELLRNTGATAALLAGGCAAASVNKGNKHLNEVQRLQRQIKRLQESSDTQIADANSRAAAAAQKVAAANAATAKLQGSISTLQSQIATLRREQKAERERLEGEILSMGSDLNKAAAAASTCQSDNSLLAGQIEALEIERMQLIYELYETAVTEAEIAQNIAAMEAQFNQDSAYQVTQKKKAKSEMVKARANYHTEIAEAHNRIEELEGKLAEKTKVAQQMLQELQGDANGSFTHLSGKANAQDEIIAGLKAQIDELRKTNKALTLQRFDEVGTDNTHGNRLIDALAKRGCVYGAYHHERTGHNGRLNVWLRIVDAPLKRAQDALDDIEAELKLWAKPSVKVSRGMHLFTLATEQEHKRIELPVDNLNRLEKDFDIANHIRLVGPTGSGKSTFLDNLIWLGRYTWPTAKMELLDPKAPFTKWQGGIVPDFKNLECVSAIANISEQLQTRFAEANQVAEEHGNDTPEFKQYVDDLAPYLFVLDEAQYLYRIAKAEDAKSSPKGKLANQVRDSLLDCLGVGRALKVKGYFITQSAKCSKLGMNDDDFDNATSVFLGSAIGNALEGELKGAFSDTRLAKVTAEYHHRKQIGQQYLALIAFSESDTLYLVQCPQPGYYYERFCSLESQSASAAEPAENQQSTDTTALQTGSEPAGDNQLAGKRQALAGKTAGDKQPSAHCPKCSHLSSKYHGTKPKPNGKYRFICENSECEKGAKKGTFSALPLA